MSYILFAAYGNSCLCKKYSFLNHGFDQLMFWAQQWRGSRKVSKPKIKVGHNNTLIDVLQIFEIRIL